MRVLVAGATSVPGIPLLRELNARGHDVVGLTSRAAKTSEIELQGAKPVVANVFDVEQINAVVADIMEAARSQHGLERLDQVAEMGGVPDRLPVDVSDHFADRPGGLTGRRDDLCALRMVSDRQASQGRRAEIGNDGR